MQRTWDGWEGLDAYKDRYLFCLRTLDTAKQTVPLFVLLSLSHLEVSWEVLPDYVTDYDRLRFVTL